MTATSANGIVPFDEKDFLPPPPETNWYHLDTDLIATICFDARGAAARSNAESDCSAVTNNSGTDDAIDKGWRLLNEDTDYSQQYLAENTTWSDFVVNQTQSKLSALYNLIRTQPGQVTLSTSHSIWLLGRPYTFSNCTVPQQQSLLEAFVHDFGSRFYFSYRRDFAPIRPSSQQADTGWGCVHRAGQMLLAETFSRHLLGRDWRVGSRDERKSRQEQEIVRWFEDSPASSVPYSIHNICQVGAMFDSPAGTWFSPSLVAHVLSFLVQSHSPANLTSVVMRDATLVEAEVHAACRRPASAREEPAALLASAVQSFRKSRDGATTATARAAGQRSLPRVAVHDGGPLAVLCESWYGEPDAAAASSTWRPALILLPLRLGVERVHERYERQLGALLKIEHCVGIVAGQPSRAYFVVGAQADAVFYLDPHQVRAHTPMPPPDTPLSPAQLAEFHCRTPRTVAMSELAPSLLVGFYCDSESSFRRLCERLRMLSQASEPIVTVCAEHAADTDGHELLQSLRPDDDPLLLSVAPNASKLSLSEEFL